jgi:hypothetical protein
MSDMGFDMVCIHLQVLSLWFRGWSEVDELLVDSTET